MSLLIAIGQREAANIPPLAVVTNAAMAATAKITNPAVPINLLAASDIGKKLVLDGATLSGVLDRMASGEWVLKETDVEDKRILRIFLTPKSKELQPRLSEARDQTNEDLLAPFTLEEKILLKRFLRDILV